ncbi:MAG: M48 family metalloprotease [Anaerolineales bacterium]|nr:M48 family metalloprotease [Anaerolineales bacterium]
MLNLFIRSVMVLALLFGLVFAIGLAVLWYFDMPLWISIIFAVGVVLLQYAIGPWILELIYKIQWKKMRAVNPDLADFVENVCAAKGIPLPRFGVIEDGNPNAFTFGHYPGDARLVVTTGLLGKLEREELQAVVAHELGHIAHWDFVVMTIAAIIPLLLYILFVGSRVGRVRRRGGGAGFVIIIVIVSYIAYIISHYIVLLLSRVREYYADQFAGEVTGNPEALSTALVKVAYGLATSAEGEKKDDTRTYAARAMGIFDPKAAQTLALAGAAAGTVSPESMTSAMKWDLWNPWAAFYELTSSHPLPAKRIRSMERQAQAMGKPTRYTFRKVRPESYWDEFLVDFLINNLPLIGFIVGVLLAAAIILLTGFFSAAIGVFLLILSGTWWMKRWFSYRHQFNERRTVHSLVDEVKVSAVRSIPCTLEGEIIGRGVPGLFYSEDLVMRDSSGFMVVDYRQPLRIFEFFFGWMKAEDLIGKRGKVMGWYRRSPRPYLEMRKLVLEDGDTITSYLYPFQQLLVYIGLGLGGFLLLLELLSLF